MPYLKYYSKEQEQLQEAYSLKVSDEDAKVIVKKLLRHFIKPRFQCNIRFFGNCQSGGAYNNGDIRLSHEPSLGLVCHEVAHQVLTWNQRQKRRVYVQTASGWKKPQKPRHHSKKLLRTVQKLYAYVKKHGFWIYILPSN